MGLLGELRMQEELEVLVGANMVQGVFSHCQFELSDNDKISNGPIIPQPKPEGKRRRMIAKLRVIARINNFIACSGIYQGMSSIDKLVELLRKRNSQPRHEERPAKARNYLTQDEIKSIRGKAAREFKLPWRGSSIEGRTTKYKPLRGKCLSNWQIDRILLSDRSFSKNLMAVKVQAANQSFYKISAKDREGHLPLVQTSLLPKLSSIQAKIRTQDFVPGRGVTTSFGMEKVKYYSPKAIERRQSSFN